MVQNGHMASPGPLGRVSGGWGVETGIWTYESAGGPKRLNTSPEWSRMVTWRLLGRLGGSLEVSGGPQRVHGVSLDGHESSFEGLYGPEWFPGAPKARNYLIFATPMV